MGIINHNPQKHTTIKTVPFIPRSSVEPHKILSKFVHLFQSYPAADEVLSPKKFPAGANALTVKFFQEVRLNDRG